jgi:hypothetical protein
MIPNTEREQFFSELEKWSEHEDAFSINEFLEQQSIAFSDFKAQAGSSQSFLKIVGKVTYRLFDNAVKAWELNKISRSQLYGYLQHEHGIKNPEFVIDDLEYEKEERVFYKKMENVENDPESALEAAINCLKKHGKSRGYG